MSVATSRTSSRGRARGRAPAPLGTACTPDRGGPAHLVLHPLQDPQLQKVHAWLMGEQPIQNLRSAVDSAIRYVLDGSRTWRFDLLDDRVDSDERSSVGTKLQYHIIEQFGLQKVAPLDTIISDIPVELKGTVGSKGSWMIPREGQCEVTLLTRIDLLNHRFTSRLMRTHRVWLSGGNGNQDKKRNTLKRPVDEFSLEVAPWTPLPLEPLKRLGTGALKEVFNSRGLAHRASVLFSYLPNTVVPRSSLETLGARLDDPMRRIRETRSRILQEHGLVVLAGAWRRDRVLARSVGHDIEDGSWVAVPSADFASPVDVNRVVELAGNRS